MNNIQSISQHLGLRLNTRLVLIAFLVVMCVLLPTRSHSINFTEVVANAEKAEAEKKQKALEVVANAEKAEAEEEQKALAELQAFKNIFANKQNFLDAVASGKIIRFQDQAPGGNPLPMGSFPRTLSEASGDLAVGYQEDLRSFLSEMLPSSTYCRGEQEIMDIMYKLIHENLELTGARTEERYSRTVEDSLNTIGVDWQDEGFENCDRKKYLNDEVAPFLQDFSDALNKLKPKINAYIAKELAIETAKEQEEERKLQEERQKELAIETAKKQERLKKYLNREACESTSAHKLSVVSSRIIQIRQNIEHHKNIIDNEDKIQKTSGVTNMNNRYAAGQALLYAQNWLNQCFSTYKSLGGKALKPSDVVEIKSTCN